MSVLFGSPSIMSFKVTFVFLTEVKPPVVNVFQKDCTWEHSKRRWNSSSFEELQKVHLSLCAKPILYSFEFVYKI